MNKHLILTVLLFPIISYASIGYLNSQTAIQPQKKIALVIGNGNYNSSTLANPENDARAMQFALQNVGFTVLEYENLNQVQMKKAIDDFGAKLKNNEVGLFFYAGHGIQSKGNNYLIPVDAQLKSEQQVEYDCVQADRILALMEASGTKVNIIILDACRNNPFERSWTRSANGSGLAFMNAPSGTLIAYATAPNSTASDGSGNNGLYTSAILESIKIPDITILQMFQNVRSIVSQKSSKQQIPWESTSLTGDFYFVPTVKSSAFESGTSNENGFKLDAKNTYYNKNNYLTAINDWKIEGTTANVKSMSIKRFYPDSTQYFNHEMTVFDNKGFKVEYLKFDRRGNLLYKRVFNRLNNKLIGYEDFDAASKLIFKNKINWISDNAYTEGRYINSKFFGFDTTFFEDGRVSGQSSLSAKLQKSIQQPNSGFDTKYDTIIWSTRLKKSYDSDGVYVRLERLVDGKYVTYARYEYYNFDSHGNWTKQIVFPPDSEKPSLIILAEYEYF
jgi:hypothetical protein